MHIAISVPKREHGVALTRGLECGAAFHCGIFAVNVVEHIGVNEHVVECGVEYGLLVVGAALNHDARQTFVPTAASLLCHGVERALAELFIEIFACIFDAYERNAHLHFYLLALGGVEVEIHAYIIACQGLGIFLIKLILASGGIPLGFGCHGALLFPQACTSRHLVDAHHKVDGEHGIGHIAECAEELESLIFSRTHAAHLGSGVVGEAFAEVKQDVTFALGEGETRHTHARCGCNFGLDAIFAQAIAVIAGMCHLVGVFAAIFLIVDGETACGGHQKQ